MKSLRIDPIVSSSNPPSARLSLGVGSHNFHVITGIWISRFGHIERRDPHTVNQKASPWPLKIYKK